MPQASQDDGDGKSTQEDSATFECNICLDTAKDAVISICGHLFCWPCLHQWLETRPQGQVCPVCKAGISRDKVIPLYGRGGSKSDPREKLPPRPQGHRTEPEAEYSLGAGANRFVFGERNTSFQMSLGIGAFPFGFFASTFNLGAGPGPSTAAMDADAAGSPDFQMQDQLVSKLFLWLACMFLLWLVAA